MFLLEDDGALELEEPGQVVDDGGEDGAEDEAKLEVLLVEGVRDGQEPLDRHGESHQNGANTADMSETVPGKNKKFKTITKQL